MPGLTNTPAPRREKGASSVYYDASKARWIVALELPSATPGQRRRRRWIFLTEADAREKARKVSAAHAALTREAGRQTLAIYVRRWLAHVAPDHLRPRTLAGYAQTLEAHVLPYLGRTRLESLDVPALRAWQHALKHAGATPRTRRYAHVVLRSALKDAVIDGTLDQNPAHVLPAPKAPRSKTPGLTPEQLVALARACQEDPIGPLVRVTLGLGLREGEVLALTTADVLTTPAGPVMRVERQVQRLPGAKGTAGALRVVPVKSDDSVRMVPIHAQVEDALTEQATIRDRLRREAGPEWRPLDPPLLFPSAVGTHQDQRNLHRRWDALRIRAHLPALRFHDLRHGYATLLRQAGVDLAVISEVLGHSGIAITQRFYGHVVPALHHEAAGRVGAVLQAAADEAKVPLTGEPMGSLSAARTRLHPHAGARNAPESARGRATAPPARNS